MVLSGAPCVMQGKIKADSIGLAAPTSGLTMGKLLGDSGPPVRLINVWC